MRSQNDATHLLKRKRTKRQRSSSPQLIPMTSSSSNGVVDGVATERGVVAEDHNSMSTSSAPTTSSGGEIYESTEEEEDMANCLIMLAQGGNIGNSNSIRKSVTEKINSRKLSTIISSEASKAGFYVYECKTCNRTFPSFQALGGHRASHKKPKSGADESKSVTVLPAREDYVTEPQFLFNNNNNNKGCKIHECSICGSEFTSGQALGGHMRRHRAAAGAAVGNNPVVVATVESHHSVDGKEVKPRTILALDLNLPAPEDDHPPPPHHHHHHRHDPGFQFGSTQQALVFSAPALVDCHY